jgi:hypothetical protein
VGSNLTFKRKLEGDMLSDSFHKLRTAKQVFLRYKLARTACHLEVTEETSGIHAG